MSAGKPTAAQLAAMRTTAKHPGWRWTSPVIQPRASTMDACRDRGWLSGSNYTGWTLTPAGRAALDAAKEQGK